MFKLFDIFFFILTEIAITLFNFTFQFSFILYQIFNLLSLALNHFSKLSLIRFEHFGCLFIILCLFGLNEGGFLRNYCIDLIQL